MPVGDSVREYLRERVRYAVRSRAWTSEDGIDEEIAQLVEDEVGELDEGLVADLRAYAGSAFAALAADEATWTSPTVNDRIDAAFAELDAAGIVALQDAGYTMSEGWYDANVLAAERQAAGRPPRGATFYHGQDTERAIDGKGLWLTFGAYERDEDLLDAASLEIGREVVLTLAKHGVRVTWPDTIEARITVDPFEWRRRGPT